MHLLPSFLILTTFVHQCFSLALGSSNPNQYDPNRYLSDLQSVQNQYKTAMTNITREIDNIKNILDNQTMNDSVRVIKLSEGMADERNTLIDIQSLLRIPYETRVCKETQLSEEELKELEQKAQDTEDKISQMKTQLINMQSSIRKQCGTYCPRYQELLIQMNKLQMYAKSIGSILHSTCKQKKYVFAEQKPTGLVDITYNIYKDNIRADNWYYGSISETDYILLRFQLGTKYNLTSCPLKTPFADYTSNTCFKCKQEGAMFNLGDRKCYSCSNLSYLNLSNSRCEECPLHQFYNHTLKKCVSCQDNQYLNQASQKCEQCQNDTYLNLTSYQCEHCPEEEYFNQQFMKCMGCNITGGQYLNATAKKCQLCPNGLFYSLTEKACAACDNGFHYDRFVGKCLACPIGYFYQTQNNQCEPCKQGQFYNTDTGKCAICSEGLIYDQLTQICKKQQTVIQIDPKCEAHYPYYNKYTKKCLKCPIDEEFIQQTYSCKKNNYIAVCHPNTPYYNQTSLSCQACPKDRPHFDPYYRVCDPCTSQAPIYDPQTSSCKKCPDYKLYNQKLGQCQTSQDQPNPTTEVDTSTSTNNSDMGN